MNGCPRRAPAVNLLRRRGALDLPARPGAVLAGGLRRRIGSRRRRAGRGDLGRVPQTPAATVDRSVQAAGVEDCPKAEVPTPRATALRVEVRSRPPPTDEH